MNDWITIAIFALITYTYIQFQILKGKQTKQALILGAFLALFDLIVENLGGILNLWTTKGSILFLGYTPIEVTITAIFSGAILYHLIPEKNKWQTTFIASLAIATLGMTMEKVLIEKQLLTYYYNWNSIYALIAYFATFVLMFKARKVIANKIKP